MGYHGTVYGATPTADRHGEANKAYSFDGNDWIEVPHSEQLNFSRSILLRFRYGDDSTVRML